MFNFKNLFKNKNFQQKQETQVQKVEEHIQTAFHVSLEIVRGIKHAEKKSKEVTKSLHTIKENDMFYKAFIVVMADKMEKFIIKITDGVNVSKNEVYALCYQEFKNIIEEIDDLTLNKIDATHKNE